MKKKDIDRIDLQILSILQKDAAVTNRELAQLIGLSPPPTLARVNALRAKGVIKKYIIKVDYNYLRYAVHRTVHIRTNVGDINEYLAQVLPLPWLTQYKGLARLGDISGKALFSFTCCAPTEEDFKEALDILTAPAFVLEADQYDVVASGDPENALIIDDIGDKVHPLN